MFRLIIFLCTFRHLFWSYALKLGSLAQKISYTKDNVSIDLSNNFTSISPSLEALENEGEDNHLRFNETAPNEGETQKNEEENIKEELKPFMNIEKIAQIRSKIFQNKDL